MATSSTTDGVESSTPDYAELKNANATRKLFSPVSVQMAPLDPVDMTPASKTPDRFETLMFEAGIGGEGKTNRTVRKESVDACLKLMIAVDQVTDDIRWSALDHLRHYTRKTLGRELILDAKALPSVLMMLMDVTSVEVVTRIVTNLAFPDPECPKVVEVLMELKVLERLFWVLEFASTETVKENALNAITNLMFSSPAAVHTIATKTKLDKIARICNKGSEQLKKAVVKLLSSFMLSDAPTDAQVQMIYLAEVAVSDVPKALVATIIPGAADALIETAAVLLMALLKPAIFCPLYAKLIHGGIHESIDRFAQSCRNWFGFTRTVHDPVVDKLKALKAIITEIETFSVVEEMLAGLREAVPSKSSFVMVDKEDAVSDRGMRHVLDVPATEVPSVEDAPATNVTSAEDVSATDVPSVEDTPATNVTFAEDVSATEVPSVEDAPATNVTSAEDVSATESLSAQDMMPVVAEVKTPIRAQAVTQTETETVEASDAVLNPAAEVEKTAKASPAAVEPTSPDKTVQVVSITPSTPSTEAVTPQRSAVSKRKFHRSPTGQLTPQRVVRPKAGGRARVITTL